MPKAVPILKSFNGGELSPKMAGRVDQEKYGDGCRTLENMIPLPQGPAMRRPGTYYAAESKDSSKKCRLVAFEFSSIQGHILEFGNNYIRFYTQSAQITRSADDSLDYNPATSYTASDTVALGCYLALECATGKFLYVASPYGQDATSVEISVATNSGDTLSVARTGSALFRRIAIKLANSTAAKNSAALIQTALRAIGNVNGIDLSAWTVTENAAYAGARPVSATLSLTALTSVEKLYACTQANQYNYFPVAATGYWSQSAAQYPYEIATTYTEAQLFELRFVQSADVLYIVHPSHKPAKLQRYAYTNWVLEDVVFGYDPGLPITGATAANPVTVSCPSHGYLLGDTVIISDVVGMTELNNRVFNVSNIQADAFDLDGADGTAYGAYVSGGLVRRNTYNGVAKKITGATNYSTSITITCPAHGYASGTKVKITGVEGMTQINDRIFTITVLDADRFNVTYARAYAEIAAGTDDGQKWQYLVIAYAEPDESGYSAPMSAYAFKTAHGATWAHYDGITVANTLTWDAIPDCLFYRIFRTKGPLGASSGLISADIPHTDPLTYVDDKADATEDPPDVTILDTITDIDPYTSGGQAQSTVFNATNEYPGVVSFYQQRLAFAVNHRIWLSKSGDYENFQTGTGDNMAIIWPIAGGKVDNVLWMVAGDALFIGTTGGVWKMEGSGSNKVLAPLNIDVARQCATGCKAIDALIADEVPVFVQRGGRIVNELSYSVYVNKYEANELTLFAEHIARGATAALSGITMLAYQNEPFSILWGIRADGQALPMTFERNQKVNGWARDVTAGQIESMAIIGQDNEEDQVWVSVERTIGGATKRYIEYFKPLNFFSQLRDYFGVDCGLTYDGGSAVDIVSITKVNPAWVTAIAHGLSDGDHVRFRNVGGMTWLNDHICTVYAKTTDGFELKDETGAAVIDASSWDIFSSDPDNPATVEKVAKICSGFSHLEGETVDILADGAVMASQQVSNGAITLDDYANMIHAGLHFDSTLEPMSLEAGSVDGTAQTKVKTIYRLGVRFHETCGCKWGRSEATLKSIPFQTGKQPQLFTGDQIWPFDGDFNTDARIIIRQDQPLPMTVVALVPRVDTYG
jgi:hypothetical protein